MRAPDTLQTPSLTLRRPRLSDAECIFEEYANDSDVTRYLLWHPHEEVGDTEAFLKLCLARWRAGTECTWVMNLPGEDRAVGMLSCRIDGHKVDLGYVLAKRLWGNGLMSEAARAVVEWALSRPAIFRVSAVCDVENLASGRVLEKAGMIREGLLRRWLIHPNVSGEPRDCYLFARTT